MTSGRTVTLILGGARSGKSRLAQEIAAQTTPVAFVATALAVDDEMRAKIARHKADRPVDWMTFEEPRELDTVLRQQAPHFSMLLVDCLTLYTANLMTSEKEDSEAVMRRADQLCETLLTIGCSVVLVSNEAGSGIVPAYASGRTFRDLLGQVNQRVAAVADNVVFMVAGLPLMLKGVLGVRG